MLLISGILSRKRIGVQMQLLSLSETFLKRFFLIELREGNALEFMNLRDGNMTIQEYGMMFNKLSK